MYQDWEMDKCFEGRGEIIGGSSTITFTPKWAIQRMMIYMLERQTFSLSDKGNRLFSLLELLILLAGWESQQDELASLLYQTTQMVCLDLSCTTNYANDDAWEMQASKIDEQQVRVKIVNALNSTSFAYFDRFR